VLDRDGGGAATPTNARPNLAQEHALDQKPWRLSTRSSLSHILRDGQVTIISASPNREDSYFVAVCTPGRTNVYRERPLKKKLLPATPDLQFLDLLHEGQATVFLYVEGRGILGHQSSLVVSIVSSEAGVAGGLAKTREFVLRSVEVDENSWCLWSGKLLGSFERGTLAVESRGYLDGALRVMGHPNPPLQLHRFADGKWVLAEERPAQ
jgi:hypothetical protein